MSSANAPAPPWRGTEAATCQKAWRAAGFYQLGGVGVHVLPTLDLGYFAEARGNVCPQATDQPSGLVISLG